jgi:hypothetical protein
LELRNEVKSTGLLFLCSLLPQTWVDTMPKLKRSGNIWTSSWQIRLSNAKLQSCTPWRSCGDDTRPWKISSSEAMASSHPSPSLHRKSPRQQE